MNWFMILIGSAIISLGLLFGVANTDQDEVKAPTYVQTTIQSDWSPSGDTDMIVDDPCPF